jgi:probable HAF family extracellular repeat protein
VVAGAILNNGSLVAARWRHGVPTPVDPRAAEATGINDRGHVTGLTNPVGHAYLFANGRFTEISAPGAQFLEGNGLNSRDEVVGKSDLGAWVWYRGHLTILPALGSSAGADRINDKGQVVGWAATDHGGNPHAVLWTY